MSDLNEFLANEVYPALFDRLDQAFPNFGFKKRDKTWVATNDDTAKLLCNAGADRVYCYANRKHCLVVQGGDAVRFLDLVNDGTNPVGVDFVNAVRDLADRAGVTFPERELSPEAARAQAKKSALLSELETAATVCSQHLFSDDGQDARRYLKSRGLSEDQMKDLRLGLYPPLAQMKDALQKAGHHDHTQDRPVLHPAMVGYIVFPWADATGRPATLTGRWPSSDLNDKPKMMNLPGEGTKTSPLYFDRARGQKSVTIVEGLFDAACPQAHGLSDVVATGGGRLTEAQAKTLARHGVQYATIFADADDAGHKGTLATIKRLEAEGIASFVVRGLPHGQDPHDYFMEDGVDGWKDRIDRAEHGMAYEARMLVANTLQGNEWTDRSRKACLDAAIEFDNAVTSPSRFTDLNDFFWPVIHREIGCDMEAVNARLDDAREKAALDLEHKTYEKLVRDAHGKIASGDLAGAKDMLNDGVKAIEKSGRKRATVPPDTMAERMKSFDLRMANYRGRDIYGMAQKTLPKLDKTLSGIHGLIVLAAQPGVGKTTLTFQIGLDILVQNSDTAFLFVSLEMSLDDMDIGALASLSGVSASDIMLGNPNFRPSPGTDLPHASEHYFPRDDYEALEAAKTKLAELSPRFRMRTEAQLGEVTVETLVDEIESLKSASGAKRVFLAVDYLNVWPAPDAIAGMNELEIDKWRIKQMQQLRQAVGRDGAVMVISELRKTNGGDETTINSIMGSARTGYAPEHALILERISDADLARQSGHKPSGESGKAKEQDMADHGKTIRLDLATKGESKQVLTIVKSRRPGKHGRVFLNHQFWKASYTEFTPDNHGDD